LVGSQSGLAEGILHIFMRASTLAQARINVGVSLLPELAELVMLFFS